MAGQVSSLTYNGVTYHVGDWVTYTGGVYSSINSTTVIATFTNYKLKITSLYEGYNQQFTYASNPLDANGNKTTYGAGSARISNVTAGGSADVPTTADDFTITGDQLGSAVTININRGYSGFTYNISATYGSGGTASVSGTSSTTWSFQTAINKVINSTSTTLSVTVTTKNGSTTIGSKTHTATLYVPESIKPTVSFTSIQAAGTVVLSTSTYVSGKNTVKAVLSGSGSNGSTISSYALTVNGARTSSSSSTVTSTNEVIGNGSVTITATVTDSRGRTGTTTRAITVTPYSQPTIDFKTPKRADQNGNEQDDGTYIKGQYSASVQNINGNAHSFVIKYSTVNNDWDHASVIDDPPSSSGYSVSGTFLQDTGETSANSKYYVQFTASDSFTSASIVRVVSPAFVLMNFNSSGRGMAIGQVSTGNNFQCALNAYFGGSVTIPILQVSSESTTGGCVEISHPTPYIDFHFGNSQLDYTSRIIEYSSGVLDVRSASAGNNALTVNGNVVYNAGNSNRDFTSGTVTLGSNLTTLGDSYCYYDAKMIFIHAYFRTTAAISANGVLLTLPQSAIAKTNINCPAWDYTAGTRKNCVVNTTPSKTVTATATITSGTAVCIDLALPRG